MRKLTGVEAKSLIHEIPDFPELFFSFANPDFIHGNIYVFSSEKAAEEAVAFLKEAGLLEEIHFLIEAKKGTEGPDFFDYGFHVESGALLFINDLSAFKIYGEDPLQQDMALLQLEEHLAYSSEMVLFANSNYIELIKGIIKAYGVEVEFLDLDK